MGLSLEREVLTAPRPMGPHPKTATFSCHPTGPPAVPRDAVSRLPHLPARVPWDAPPSPTRDVTDRRASRPLAPAAKTAPTTTTPNDATAELTRRRNRTASHGTPAGRRGDDGSASHGTPPENRHLPRRSRAEVLTCDAAVPAGSPDEPESDPHEQVVDAEKVVRASSAVITREQRASVREGGPPDECVVNRPSGDADRRQGPA